MVAGGLSFHVRFSLRTLIVLTALCACAVSWVMWYLEGRRPIEWQRFSVKALEKAWAEGKPVLVDFYAQWNTSVVIHRYYALDRPSVRRFIRRSGIVPLHADWTDGDPEITQRLEKLGQTSIPLVALFPASDGPPIVLGGEQVTESGVLAALQELTMTEPDRRLSARTVVAGVVLVALLFGYVGAYYALSRRGMREANELGLEGFLYIPFAEAQSSQDLSHHRLREKFFRPLSWLDQRLFGAPPPTKGITWTLAE